MNDLKGVLRLTTVMFLFIGFFGLLAYAEETQEQQVERLIRELQDEDSNIRSNAEFALSSIGEGAKEAVPALRQLLQDKDVYVRRIARETLSEIGSVDAVPILIQASKKSNSGSKKLTADDIFPADRVLDVQITVDPKDWDTIRYQSRNFFEAL